MACVHYRSTMFSFEKAHVTPVYDATQIIMLIRSYTRKLWNRGTCDDFIDSFP
jgi:hypothetical protein